MRDPKKLGTPTVLETLAFAEAWNERAAILSTLAFELSDLFGSSCSGLPPPYLIRRLAGGASAPNPELVDDIHAELMLSAKRAREKVTRLLGAVTDASTDEVAPSLAGGERNVAPPVRFDTIKVPDGGEEIEANPECARARRNLELVLGAKAALSTDVDAGAATEHEDT